MPHEFRTIEEFVKWLDERSSFIDMLGNMHMDQSNEWRRGYCAAMKEVGAILRHSNIGIVYPPGGSK